MNKLPGLLKSYLLCLLHDFSELFILNHIRSFLIHSKSFMITILSHSVTYVHGYLFNIYSLLSTFWVFIIFLFKVQLWTLSTTISTIQLKSKLFMITISPTYLFIWKNNFCVSLCGLLEYFLEKKLPSDYPCKSHDHDYQWAVLVMA